MEGRGIEKEFGERGVFIPMIAVLAVPLIVTLVVLGVETTRVKSAAVLLKRRLEAVCRSTARSSLVASDALKIFSASISQLRLEPGTKITGVRLVMPLPLGDTVDGLLFDTGARETCQASNAGIPPHSPVPNVLGAIPFASIPATGGELSYRCQNGAHFADDSIDCMLASSVCSEGQPDPRYPRTLWSDILNAGNTVGCEIDAELDPILSFLPSREISAKAAWWIPLVPVAPYLAEGGSGTPHVGDFSGLSLGISTQLTTWAGGVPGGQIGDARFSVVPSWYHQWLVEMDPRAPQLAPLYQRHRFDFSGGERRFSDQYSVPGLEKLSGESSSLTGPQEEILAACFNPLTFTRNMLLAALVELAARSGQTRNMTEIAHINPHHQRTVGGGAPPGNRPVIMVPFGADLLSARYQHPFVTYDSGSGHSLAKDGFILPWKGYGGSDNDKILHHTLVAQQLRACYHLYVDNDIASNIPRIGTPLSVSPSALTPSLLKLTETSLHSVGVPASWDFTAPWPGQIATGNGRLLTAPELLYSLGSSQACPIDESVRIEHWQSLGCSKAGLSTFDDLVPDLPAYLEYQARGGNRAYPSPGLSPPIDEDGDILDPAEGEQPNLSQPQKLTTGSGYQLARSVVVVFTHKGLLAERVPPIRSLVQEINQQGRPVIVIFMPATYTDSATYGNFCAALDLEPDCTSNENSNLNSFFFLSPFNSDYGTYYSHAAPDITREEYRAFSLYWSDLMSDLPSATDDPFYLDIARSIFVEKILKLEPKL